MNLWGWALLVAFGLILSIGYNCIRNYRIQSKYVGKYLRVENEVDEVTQEQIGYEVKKIMEIFDKDKINMNEDNEIEIMQMAKLQLGKERDIYDYGGISRGMEEASKEERFL